MAQDNQKTAQNYFEQIQSAFTANAQSFDFSKAASTWQSIAQKTTDPVTAASKAVFESAQSLAKSQAEFYQKQAEQISAAANKSFSASKPEDNIENGAKLAQKSIDANLKNSQEVAKSASEAVVEAFDILNKQAVKNMNEISELSKAS